MDVLASINSEKDSTLAMMEAAQARGWELHVMHQSDLSVQDGVVFGHQRVIRTTGEKSAWFEPLGEIDSPLTELDAILLRKDPPFDMVSITYLLEMSGANVLNNPAGQDCNEKLCLLPPVLSAAPCQRIQISLRLSSNPRRCHL